MATWSDRHQNWRLRGVLQIDFVTRKLILRQNIYIRFSRDRRIKTSKRRNDKTPEPKEKTIVYRPEWFLNNQSFGARFFVSSFCRFVFLSFCDRDRRAKWFPFFWITYAPGDDCEDRHGDPSDQTWVCDQGPTRQSNIWMVGWGIPKSLLRKPSTNKNWWVIFLSNFRQNEVCCKNIHCATMSDSRKLVPKIEVIKQL